MRKRWQIITLRVLSLILIGAFSVLSIMSFRQGQPISNSDAKIEINYHDGHSFIHKEIIRNKVKEFFADSNTVHSASLRLLEEYLQTHPHIQKANTYIDSKGQLHVDITQINPIARVISSFGSQYYIDDEGLKAPLSTQYTAKVPILSGFIKEPLEDKEAVKSDELKSMVNIIRYAQEDEYWEAQTAQLYINSLGTIYLIPRLGNHTVILGDDSDIEEKLKRLEIFYNHISKKAGWDSFKYINVQFKNQIVCK